MLRLTFTHRSLSTVFLQPKPVLNFAPCRGMATEQQLKRRLKTVGNIKKITKAMKMVAAAKLRSVQNQLEIVRNFQKGVTDVWAQPEGKDIPIEKAGIVCITSDRGLCGSINSSVSKQARQILRDATTQKKALHTVLLGEKGKGALERLFGRTFSLSISDAYKSKVMSFKQVAMITDLVLSQNFDRMEIIYNRFKNLLSFETKKENLYSWKILAPLANSQFSRYEIESDGYSSLLQNLYEYRTATRLFHLFQENATSEQSARMNAMGNSSKNAADMQDSLRLLYNRTRQAKITTELIEIISGASAADESKKKK